MPTTTLTLRLDDEAKRRLEALSKSTGRSRSFLAADAIREYLDINEWQVAGVHAAIQSLDAKGGIAHGDVSAWVDSWTPSGRGERAKPKRP